MTPAETLDRHAREADRLAHDWPAWRDRPIPDGSPGAARTDGMPRSGDVPDPVGETVVRRDGMLVKDGVNLETQVANITWNVVTLAWSMINAVDPDDNRPCPTPSANPMPWVRLMLTKVWLSTSSTIARRFANLEWLYDDEPIQLDEALSLIESNLRRLRQIIPATPVVIDDATLKPAKCEGWGPHAGSCTHLGNHGTKRLPDGTEEIDNERRRLCARCHELATFRCSACGEGLDPANLPQRPIISGMHQACYRRNYRAEDAA